MRYIQADAVTLEVMEFALAYEAPFWMGGCERPFAAAVAWERELVFRAEPHDPYLDWIGRIDIARRMARIFQDVITVQDIHDLVHRPFPSKGLLP